MLKSLEKLRFHDEWNPSKGVPIPATFLVVSNLSHNQPINVLSCVQCSVFSVQSSILTNCSLNLGTRLFPMNVASTSETEHVRRLGAFVCGVSETRFLLPRPVVPVGPICFWVSVLCWIYNFIRVSGGIESHCSFVVKVWSNRSCRVGSSSSSCILTENSERWFKKQQFATKCKHATTTGATTTAQQNHLNEPCKVAKG